jgi:hypothetical protein
MRLFAMAEYSMVNRKKSLSSCHAHCLLDSFSSILFGVQHHPCFRAEKICRGRKNRQRLLDRT